MELLSFPQFLVVHAQRSVTPYGLSRTGYFEYLFKHKDLYWPEKAIYIITSLGPLPIRSTSYTTPKGNPIIPVNLSGSLVVPISPNFSQWKPSILLLVKILWYIRHPAEVLFSQILHGSPINAVTPSGKPIIPTTSSVFYT